MRHKNSEGPPAVRQRRLSKKSLPRQVEHSFLKQRLQFSNVLTRKMEITDYLSATPNSNREEWCSLSLDSCSPPDQLNPRPTLRPRMERL